MTEAEIDAARNELVKLLAETVQAEKDMQAAIEGAEGCIRALRDLHARAGVIPGDKAHNDLQRLVARTERQRQALATLRRERQSRYGLTKEELDNRSLGGDAP